MRVFELPKSSPPDVGFGIEVIRRKYMTREKTSSCWHLPVGKAHGEAGKGENLGLGLHICLKRHGEKKSIKALKKPFSKTY